MSIRNSTIRVEFRDLLDIKMSDNYLSFASKVLESQYPDELDVQKVAVPTSSDQPEDFPFIMVQTGGSQLIIARRYLQYTYNDDKVDSEIANISARQVGSIFKESKQSPIHKSNIRQIDAQINTLHPVDSYSKLVERLGAHFKTDLIISGGFTFNYNINSSYDWATYVRKSYASGINMSERKLALQVTSALTLGGIDLESMQYLSVDESQVDGFITGYTKEVVEELIASHGKEEK